MCHDPLSVAADHNTGSLTPPFTALVDLASARVGARAIAANDEFFAPKSNLVKPEPAKIAPKAQAAAPVASTPGNAPNAASAPEIKR